MGMRDEIQTELAEAFEDDLADAIDSFTCTRKTIISSNPATGQDVYDEKVYVGRGVLFGSWAKDLVKPIDYQATDSKAVVLRNEVVSDGAEIEPKIGDVWVINARKYKVISYGSEPSKSIWTVQLRMG